MTGSDGRDPGCEINDLIDDLLDSDEDIVPAVAAEKIVATLEETNPELLDVWLHLVARAVMTAAITDRIRRIRASAAANAGRVKFGRAAKSGDPAELGVFSVRLHVDDNHTQRRTGDMRGPDHLYVSGEYQKEGKLATLRAAFHKKVAARVGDKRTCEVFTEEEYAAMLASIK
jgi:hypothetical protein